MKKLYYAGMALEKDLQFCKILKEVESSKETFILSVPKQCEVIEMKYTGRGSERVETGNKHIGYEYHYITFLYKGLVISLNPSPYYPFVDVNNPGVWNFNIYLLTTPATKQQASYSVEYKNLKSIDDYISTNNFKVLSGTNKQYIYLGVTNNVEKIINSVVNSKGGNREKEIYINGCFFHKSETWNDSHKVINVLSIKPEEDGYFPGFAVDIVTGDICG